MTELLHQADEVLLGFTRALRAAGVAATWARRVVPWTCRRGGWGRTSRTRSGMRVKLLSSSSAITWLRCAVEVPPKTEAISRLLPRCAEAVRLKPAARV